MISTEHLADLFVEVADTLVDDFDVIDFLHNLTVNAATVSGAGAVGLVLADQRGHLRFMGASSDRGRELEMIQLEMSEGPCLDCFFTGQAVVNADLDSAADRWPQFAPRAVEAGFQSVHAFPMRLRDEAIGALNLFGHADVRFAAEDVRVIQALADVATIAILQERTVARAELLTEQLQSALTSRVVIEQAKGVVATVLGIGVDEAFERMRVQARSSQVRIIQVAQAALDGDVSGWTDRSWGSDYPR